MQTTSLKLSKLLPVATAMRGGNMSARYMVTAVLMRVTQPFVSAKATCRPNERSVPTFLDSLAVPSPRALSASSRRPILANLLLDASAEVAECALIAMGHLELEVDGVILTSLAAHPSADVRYAVAVALPNSGGAMTSALLVLLMDDPDDDVRNWATFGLGSTAEDDSPQIREALLARTADAHDETRGEALVGLALRRDLRVIAPLLRELESGCVGRLAVEAARDIGAPELLPALQSIAPWWDVDPTLLAEAIAACSPSE